MAQDYAEYLAVNVLNEQRVVSYRTLSRALKVHCNLAKQMLYEFHRKQNVKKPGSVHATYLISGLKTPEQRSELQKPAPQQDGEDTVMQSSPPIPGSSIPLQEDGEESPALVRGIMLAREEHVEQAQATFESITGLHIYTLEVGLGDLQVLTECNRQIAAEYASEDPLKDWRQYGVIQNPLARRRTRKTAAPAPPPVKDEKTKAAAVAPTSKGIAMQKPSVRDTDSDSKATPEPEKETSKPAAKKPANVKRESSSLFKSFAKAKDKPKRQDSSHSATSASASPAPHAEDEPMQGMSEDEADDGAAEEEEEPAKVPGGKSKKEREADLQAMMDQEDEDEPMEDAADEGALDKPTEAKEDSQPSGENTDNQKESVTVEGGRRRGRRRVMKKKTVKDEEGYLVTREEAAWESFSEEEPAPKKPKMQPAASTAKGAASKKGGKPGQGNIMSFFGKK
ncbi:hypothetical protein MBLNU230_g1721t1 [Neophaeotheca triangularis]